MIAGINQSAFPVGQNDRYDGMELRDYFAAKFSATILTAYQNSSEPWGDNYACEIAREAYNLADAMMAIRLKKLK